MLGAPGAPPHEKRHVTIACHDDEGSGPGDHGEAQTLTASASLGPTLGQAQGRLRRFSSASLQSLQSAEAAVRPEAGGSGGGGASDSAGPPPASEIAALLQDLATWYSQLEARSRSAEPRAIPRPASQSLSPSLSPCRGPSTVGMGLRGDGPSSDTLDPNMQGFQSLRLDTAGNSIAGFGMHVREVTATVRQLFKTSSVSQYDHSAHVPFLLGAGRDGLVGGRQSDFDTGRRRRWLQAVDPNFWPRMILDWILVVVCIQDTALVPFVLAWNPPPSTISLAANLVSVTFWCIDIILNFFTAYSENGVIVTNLRSIAMRYLRSSFLVDFVVTGCDLFAIFLELVLKEDSDKMLYLKMLRILKLSKLARASLLMQRAMVRLKFMHMSIFGLGSRLVVTLLGLNHLLCCGWFWVGKLSLEGMSDTGKSWLDMSITSGGLRYREADIHFQYLTSFHWSLTQMTPGSMSVVPQNSLERSFNLVCLCIGLFVSALLVSQLSAKMVRVQTVNHDNLQQVELLRNFLLQQGVPPHMGREVQLRIKERVEATKPLVEKDVASLKLLPSSLRHELAVFIHGRVFLRHTVFLAWCTHDPEVVWLLASRATELLSFVKDEEVFRTLDEAQTVYCLMQGEAVYKRNVARVGATASEQEKGYKTTLTPSSWVSTIALWCHWTYLGRLRADRPSTFLAMNVEAVLGLLRRKQGRIFHEMSRFAQAYAFLAHTEECIDTADLDINAARVLMAMTLEDRFPICLTVLEHMAGFVSSEVCRHVTMDHKVKHEQVALLKDELDTGKAVVTLDTDGQALRAVILVTVTVRKPGGELLVRIGSTKGTDLVPDVCLPGTKVRAKESLREAADRICEEALGEVARSLVFMAVQEMQETSMSKRHGVKTIYMKTNFHLSTPSVQAPELPGSPTSTQGRKSRISNAGPFKFFAQTQVPYLLTGLEPFIVVRADDPTKKEVYAWVEDGDFQLLKATPHEEVQQYLTVFQGQFASQQQHLDQHASALAGPAAAATDASEGFASEAGTSGLEVSELHEMLDLGSDRRGPTMVACPESETSVQSFHFSSATCVREMGTAL